MRANVVRDRVLRQHSPALHVLRKVPCDLATPSATKPPMPFFGARAAFALPDGALCGSADSAARPLQVPLPSHPIPLRPPGVASLSPPAAHARAPRPVCRAAALISQHPMAFVACAHHSWHLRPHHTPRCVRHRQASLPVSHLGNFTAHWRCLIASDTPPDLRHQH